MSATRREFITGLTVATILPASAAGAAVRYSRYALHVNSRLWFQGAVGLSCISNVACDDETRDKLMRAAEERS